MEKILKITFKNAKLFPFDKNCKDVVFDLGVKTKRVEQKMFQEPITIYHISNVLHVMMGERPVPSFRYSVYERVGEIFELAKNSYLKIDTVKYFNKFKGKDEFPFELLWTNKAVDNSFSKSIVMTWKKLELLMGDNFDEFINKVNEKVGYDILNKSFSDLEGLAKDNECFNDVISWLKEIRLTPLANCIVGKEYDFSYPLKEMTLNGVSRIQKISGVIYVSINESFLNRIIMNTVKILDGGIATIEGVYDKHDLVNEDTNGVVKVSKLSMEKVEKIESW